jgi:hypothetical protein
MEVVAVEVAAAVRPATTTATSSPPAPSPSSAALYEDHSGLIGSVNGIDRSRDTVRHEPRHWRGHGASGGRQNDRNQ